MKNYFTILAVIVCNTITSLINQIVIAYYFGAGQDLDTLNIAMALPNSVMAVSLGTLSLFLIPIISSAKAEGKNLLALIKYFEKKTTFWGIIIIVTITIFQIFIFRNSFFGTFFIKFVSITIISNLFIYTTLNNSIYISWANVEKKYFLTSFGSSFLNLTSITFIYLFHSFLGVLIIATSLLLGNIMLNYLIKTALIKKALHIEYESYPILLNKQLIGSVLSIIPFAFPSFVDSYFLSKTLNGFASYAGYANKFLTVLGILIIQPFNIILFPMFNDLFLKNKIDQIRKLFDQTIVFTFTVSSILLIFVYFFFDRILFFVFNHGEFKLKDVIELSNLLKIYSFGLFGMTMMNIINRILTVFCEYKVQILFGIIFIPIYYLLIIFFYPLKGNFAIAWAYVISWSTLAVSLIIYLNLKYWRFNFT